MGKSFDILSVWFSQDDKNENNHDSGSESKVDNSVRVSSIETQEVGYTDQNVINWNIKVDNLFLGIEVTI